MKSEDWFWPAAVVVILVFALAVSGGKKTEADRQHKVERQAREIMEYQAREQLKQDARWSVEQGYMSPSEYEEYTGRDY